MDSLVGICVMERNSGLPNMAGGGQSEPPPRHICRNLPGYPGVDPGYSHPCLEGAGQSTLHYSASTMFLLGNVFTASVQSGERETFLQPSYLQSGT